MMMIIMVSEFNMVCRLIAHMQSGASSVDPSLLNLEPASLPIFDGNNNMIIIIKNGIIG